MSQEEQQPSHPPEIDTPPEYIWQSHPPNLRLTAEPGYDPKGRLCSLKLTLKDFTFKEDGAAFTETLQPVQCGKVLSLQPEESFTASGRLRVAAAFHDSNHLILFSDGVQYGERRERRALGGLLEIPTLGPAFTQGAPPPEAPPSDLVWLSGDFTNHSHATEPFNGLRLTAEPEYDPEGELSSLKITLEDFTAELAGAPFTVTLESVEVGQEVKLESQGRFTVSGTLRLEASGIAPKTHLLLTCERIRYGLPGQAKRVSGGLLEIPLTGP